MNSLVLGSVVPSLIRTYVPVGVGALLSLLVTTGVLPTPLPEDAAAGVVTAVTAVGIGAYYTLVRLLERWKPGFGVLLGSTQQPVDYAAGAKVKSGEVVAAPRTLVRAPAGDYGEDPTYLAN